jgi:NADPH2:quinone reductase
LNQFGPMANIPNGVYLTVFSSHHLDIKQSPLDQYVQKVANGEFRANVDQVFNIEQVVAAHEYMESNEAKGKVVVLVGE